jgi:hypothetical protein
MFGMLNSPGLPVSPVGDVVPFRQTGPRPLSLEGGMSRSGGGGGSAAADLRLLQQALNSRNPQTQAMLEQVWSKLTPEQLSIITQKLNAPR